MSILDKLEKLLSKHFRVERGKCLKVHGKVGKFPRRDMDMITRIADRYNATVQFVGYVNISKKGGRPGQNSQRRKRNANRHVQD